MYEMYDMFMMFMLYDIWNGESLSSILFVIPRCFENAGILISSPQIHGSEACWRWRGTGMDMRKDLPGSSCCLETPTSHVRSVGAARVYVGNGSAPTQGIPSQSSTPSWNDNVAGIWWRGWCLRFNEEQFYMKRVPCESGCSECAQSIKLLSRGYNWLRDVFVAAFTSFTSWDCLRATSFVVVDCVY